ncbi:MAG: RNA polymerase sigma factor [Gammaproteobacteria bacterium]|nr:RNA polymerase sigma factor [Gammaproteobacteria bacterium]
MKNNKQDFSTAIRPYIPKIKQIALKLSGNSNDAKDLIQESLIKIYPVFFNLNPDKNIAAWIARVVYNTYIDHWRKQQSQNQLQVIDWQNSPELYRDMTTDICPCLLLEMDEEQKRTTRALYLLKNEYRVVIILHDIEGYTIKELAGIFSEPEGTIKTRLHRGRNKLKEILNRCQVQKKEYVA